jgi:WS/DGAT/MGAT family acyltransferase
MTERLTAADSWFLYLETPTVHLHVTGLVVLDPATAPDGLTFRRLRDEVATRLHRLPSLQRRLVEVPLGIDHPTMVEDPDFDLDHHLTHHVLERGDHRELAEFVGAACSEQLDRTRPLWRMAYVEGLADGRTALVTTLHHALVDGVSGVGFMAELLDVRPDAPPPPPPQVPWQPERVPPPPVAAAEAAHHRLVTPLRPLRAVARTGRSLLGTTVAALRARAAGTAAAGPFDAPRTPLNATLTPRRTVEFGTTPLSGAKAVRSAFGVTVNDVVLAACTAGLRRFLLRQGVEPTRPLTCSVPVSVHGRTSAGRRTAPVNQLSNMFVHLPVHLEDPVEQLLAVARSAAGAKAVQDAMSPEMIGDVVDLIPPPLFHFGAELWSRARLADRLPPVHNLIISNVRGSPVPLYLAGARVAGLFPFGPLMEGTGLNVTVISHEADLDVGFIACPDLVPDLGTLMADVLDGFDTLRRRADPGRPGRCATRGRASGRSPSPARAPRVRQRETP